jgi:hypothetical protein
MLWPRGHDMIIWAPHKLGMITWWPFASHDTLNVTKCDCRTSEASPRTAKQGLAYTFL